MDRAELSTEQVLKWDTPWETYITTKLITGTCLQLLRRYDHKSERQRAALLDDMALEWELVHPRKELQNIVPHYECPSKTSGGYCFKWRSYTFKEHIYIY